MTREEIEKIIAQQTDNLLNTHKELMSNIDLDVFRSHGLAISFQESKFDEKAKNKTSTAKGLFQILDGTRRDIEKRILKINDKSPYDDIWKPEYNTYLALGYLAYQYKRYKMNWNKAVIAYNLGSWKNQGTTAYLQVHNKAHKELYPNGVEIESGIPDFAMEYNFKLGFK